MKNTTKKTKLRVVEINKYNARIRRENAAFRRMSPAMKRVTIAQDVVDLIYAKKLVPKSGTWVADAKARDRDSALSTFRQASLFRGKEELAENAQLKDLLSDVEQCNACAVGAVFYCTVMRANDVTVEDVRSGRDDSKHLSIQSFDQMTGYLGKFFAKRQLHLMELAFERGEGGTDEDITFFGLVATRMFQKVVLNPEQDDLKDSFDEDDMEWSSDKTTDEERLLMIMQNVIDNKGTFVPELRCGR